MLLEEAGSAMSTPRLQAWPMPAWTPERGSSTPTLSGAPWARTTDGAAISAV